MFPIPMLSYCANAQWAKVEWHLVKRLHANLIGDRHLLTIPPLPIPLMLGEVEPILELQPLLDRVYEKGPYYLAIDYTRPPQPPLSEEDTQWVETLLKG